MSGIFGALARGVAGGLAQREERRRFDEQQALRERQQAATEELQRQLAALREAENKRAEMRLASDLVEKGQAPYQPGMMDAEGAAQAMATREGVDVPVPGAGTILSAAEGFMQRRRAGEENQPGQLFQARPSQRLTESLAQTRTQGAQQRERDAELARIRGAERAEDREFTLARDAAGTAARERELRLAASLRPQPQQAQYPTMVGSDGNVYERTPDGLRRVPILGEPSASPSQNTAPSPAPMAPGDTLLQGLGIARAAPPTAPTTQAAPAAPQVTFGGAARGGGGAPKLPAPVMARLEFTDKAMRAVDDYITELKKVGPSLMALGDKDAVRLKTLYTKTLLAIKEGENLGVLNGRDLEVIEGMLTPPIGVMGTIRGGDALLEQAMTLREKFGADNAAIRKQYGVGDAGTTEADPEELAAYQAYLAQFQRGGGR